MNYDLSLLNSQPDMVIRTSDLRVSPYEIERLLEVSIHQEINEHGKLYLKGVLSKSQEDDYAKAPSKGTVIALSTVDSSGEEFILFQGVVMDLNIHVSQETRYIEVHAVSYSYLLDIEKKSRTFQNKKMTYTALAEQVTSSYEGATVIDAVTNGAATEKFIIQYMETDWEFLKRLASHFNTGLICDVKFDTPKYFIGIPKTKLFVLDCGNYSVKKDMQRFNRLSENGVDGLMEHDFIYYEVETNYVFRVGDEVLFQEQTLYVSEITSTAVKGRFVSHIVLTPINGLSQLYIPNTNVIGASFNGHIIEAKNDRVKVSLDIDKGHDPGPPCFFPYSTIYSSQDGSGWYCMPEIGDTVRIYHPDGEDDHAYAISSVHEQVDPALAPQGGEGGNSAGGGVRAAGIAGSYSGMRDDPNVKSLTYGDKEIRLAPEGVYIIMDSSIVTMTEEGVIIMSENDIKFMSDKNIILSAEADVNIVGAAGVDLMCGEATSVMLDRNVQVIGHEVKAN